MKKLACLVFIGLLTLMAFSLETLKFSTASVSPYIDEENPGKGIIAELYNVILKNAGYKLEYAFYPMQRTALNIEKGDYRIGFGLRSTMTENMYYIPLLNTIKIIFYKKKLNFIFNEISDLKKYTISVLNGSDTESYLKKAEIQVESVNNIENILKKVYVQRTDIGIMADLIFYAAFKSEYRKWRIQGRIRN